MSSPGTLTEQEANDLVVEHRGWAESIARSVARGWNLDWQMDGLDGAAMEALIFCSRRFDPARGVPFKGYARRRIHEASTEAARKTKGWKRSRKEGGSSQAREISSGLMNVFPELRSGAISGDESADSGEGSLRSGIRQLLVGATLIASQQASPDALPDEMADYKRIIEKTAVLEPIHQQLVWKVYWEGSSMRGLATFWETDELNVIREHKAILGFLMKAIKAGKKELKPLKIRPGLKDIALRLKAALGKGIFRRLLDGEPVNA